MSARTWRTGCKGRRGYVRCRAGSVADVGSTHGVRHDAAPTRWIQHPKTRNSHRAVSVKTFVPGEGKIERIAGAEAMSGRLREDYSRRTRDGKGARTAVRAPHGRRRRADRVVGPGPASFGRSLVK